jgi:hypothetical protein
LESSAKEFITLYFASLLSIIIGYKNDKVTESKLMNNRSTDEAQMKCI